MRLHHLLHLFIYCLSVSISLSYEVQLILVNNCNYSVWPGTLGNAGHVTPVDGGLHLSAFEEAVFEVPNGWSGRVWGRRGCCFDEHGKGSCETGDCAGRLRCGGLAGKPPATVVEMAFGSPKAAAVDYYDVSLVDGFNIPVTMGPIGGGIGCGVAGCKRDLNVCCPSRFEVKRQGREGAVAVVGCMSACQALGKEKYCCTGEYSSRKVCRPTIFSHLLKSLCPRTYTYPYDDRTGLNMCKVASRYVITFCPPPA